MSTLWVLQTNEQGFMDDCRDFRVYGVRTPEYMGLQQLSEGDTVLLRLRNKRGHSEFSQVTMQDLWEETSMFKYILP